MKKIIIFLSILTINLLCNGQDIPDDGGGGYEEDIDAPQTTPYIDWGSSLYTSFFANSSSSSGLKSYSNLSICYYNFISYNQADPSWKNQPLAQFCNNCINKDGIRYGINNTSRCGIGHKGCAVTCQAMVLANFGYTGYNPDKWNDYLISWGGFSGCGLDFSRDDMFLRTFKTTSVYVSKQYIVNYTGSTDDEKIAKIFKWVIDKCGLIVLKVNRLGKGDGTVVTRKNGHFIVLYGYYNINPTLKDFFVSDPGTSYDENNPYRTLKDYYDPELKGVSPIFISTDRPSIRFYLRHDPSVASNYSHTISFPQANYETGQNLSLSVSNSNLKSNIETNVLWTIKKPNNEVKSYSGESISFKLYTPGDYTITVAVFDNGTIYNDIKNITVTGECIPESSINSDIRDLEITQNNIKYSYMTGEFDRKYDICFCCGYHANKLNGPNYEKVKYGHYYNFDNLSPNTQYQLWAGFHDCSFCINCEDKFYDYNYLVITTTPLNLNRNSDMSNTNPIDDQAFSTITLSSGFYYSSSGGSQTYSATVVNGQQVVRRCGK